MIILSTQSVAVNGVKMLVYGQAGAGKTTLIKTLPNPIILSAESGLLSLSGYDLPYIEINNIEELSEAYNWFCTSDEAKQYKSIALDSLSEIAEVVLSEEKAINKDGRAAYGALAERMTVLIRAFRDLPGRNVYFSAKVEQKVNEMGQLLYCPSMPGATLTQKLPYFFDEVMALRVVQDKEGVSQRVLQCAPDGLWGAKDRSGRLDYWESPDLGHIISKIAGASTGQEAVQPVVEEAEHVPF